MRPCLQEEDLQVYVDGELTAGACAEMRAHLAECMQCAANVREMGQAFVAIGGAFDEELPRVVPTARLRARIESALAEKAAPRLTPAQLCWRLAWSAASMLAVASVIVWFAFGPRSSRSPKPDQEAQTVSPAPSTAPQAPLPQPSALERAVAQQPLTPRLRWHAHRQASESDSGEAEAVTQFFPLREGEDFTVLESARLVRVELPSSALGEIGLPVDTETANAPVKADVVLGQDGLARAIRFVL